MLIFPAALGHAQQPPSIPQNLPGNAQLVVSPSPFIDLHFVLLPILPWFSCGKDALAEVRGMDTQTLTDPPPLPLLSQGLAQAAPQIGKKWALQN